MKLMTLSFIAASAFSLTFLGLSNDQDIPQSEVPSVVLNAVTTAYPNATNMEWEKQNDLYEAEFDVDAKEYTVQLNTTGSIVQTKYDVADTELPVAIKNIISTNYKDLKLDDAEMVEKSGRAYYQVELEGRLKSKSLVLDEAGKELAGVSYWD